MRRWAVAQVEPGKHRLATYHAEDQGAEVYMPKFFDKMMKARYLFEQYGFFNCNGDWSYLARTPGISHVLMQSRDMPATLGDSVVQQFRRLEGRDGIIRLPKKPRFLPGQAVKITAGLFKGSKAIWAGSSSLEREMVLLSMLGRTARVSVSAGSLVAA